MLDDLIFAVRPTEEIDMPTALATKWTMIAFIAKTSRSLYGFDQVLIITQYIRDVSVNV